MVRECKMYINGEWIEANSKTLFDDFIPYTGELFARVANAGKEDARLAIEAAARAFPAWAAVPPARKRILFLKVWMVLKHILAVARQRANIRNLSLKPMHNILKTSGQFLMDHQKWMFTSDLMLDL